jgi:hypothetical protein
MTATTEPQFGADLPFVVSADALKAHQADLARRAKEREEKQEKLYRCLDHRYAMECELKKPHYKYTVEVEWWTQAAESKEKKKHRGPMEIGDDNFAGDRLVVRKEKRVVVAQSEGDAWALFCDAIQHWPSPNLPGMKKKFTRSKEPVDAEMVLSLIQDTRS